MENHMQKLGSRLLMTTLPEPDESLTGYLVRLSTLNNYKGPTYQRMKSALYEEFGSFYSGLNNVLSGNQFDFMRGAFIEYITQNRMLNCLPDPMSHKPVEDSLRSQYILKSDVRKLLGVDYAWINNHIATGRLRTVVRSKGKKRLIFIETGDVARLRAEH
jgi:hypothetical protein